ncbi:hypothetical protein CLV59_101770 [Chitinophaga dinghuensis]|uniref:Uncharacterized protein n=1 Tax=Chitinophaga dinghuensis TaxID=1539050 RepID=A0A327WBW3_9BACT|nr:hypothetical protein [Chitinophaga dinghuensis]RAJ88005.1 hypothetical protein CLV59_101770 [Chitinophaga dinghuensis]
MKKLEKLNEKKVESLETIKGGLMALQPEFSLEDGQEKTTYNEASWNGKHWVTDTRPDAK